MCKFEVPCTLSTSTTPRCFERGTPRWSITLSMTLGCMAYDLGVYGVGDDTPVVKVTYYQQIYAEFA